MPGCMSVMSRLCLGYISAITLQVVNVPGVRDLELATFWNEAALRIVVYTSVSSGPHLLAGPERNVYALKLTARYIRDISEI